VRGKIHRGGEIRHGGAADGHGRAVVGGIRIAGRRTIVAVTTEVARRVAGSHADRFNAAPAARVVGMPVKLTTPVAGT